MSGGCAPAVLLLALLAGTAAAQASQPVRFEAWTADCTSRRAGYCSANAFINRDDPTGFLEWRLRVALPGFFAAPAVSLVAVRHAVAPQADIEFRVDGGETLRFAPGSGWRPGTAPNDYHLVDEPAAGRLLAAMREGTQLSFRYLGADGDTHGRQVPLAGLGRAFDFITGARQQLLPPFANGSEQAPWVRRVHGLVPVMHACLRHAPAQPAVVVEALPANRNRTLARVIAEGGERFDCVAAPASAVVESFEPAQAWPPQSLAGPWYLPGRRPPPEDACAGHLPLVDRALQPLGWLLYGCEPPA